MSKKDIRKCDVCTKWSGNWSHLKSPIEEITICGECVIYSDHDTARRARYLLRKLPKNMEFSHSSVKERI